MKFNNILEAIGQTPHLKINKLFSDIEVWLKLEQQNPGGSIKDRIALAMIEDAEKKGLLKQGTTIVEATSGNTGIGLAMVAAVKGYNLTIVMPESMSIERRKLMKAYGAKLELSPKEKGMNGALSVAKVLVEELKAQGKDIFIPNQFENGANPEIHRQTTAQEIIKDFPEGLDYLFCGVGTGGHITGIGEVLKKQFPKLKVIAVEPSESPVLSGEAAGPHGIQGIGAGFIPKILNQNIFDEIVKVKTIEAKEMLKAVAQKEGCLFGISSGAVLAALEKKREEIPSGAKVLAMSYDTGERYLSTADLFSE